MEAGCLGQARNLIVQLEDDQPIRFLIHDRDKKFSGTFDEVFRSDGITVISTPVRAPNANAYTAGWVRIPRRLPRPDTRPRPPPTRARAPRLPTARHPRRTHPRIQSRRMSLRTLRA